MSVPTITNKYGKHLRLGRIEPRVKPQVLRLSYYLMPTRAPYPDTVDYSPKAAAALKQMYLNDQYGDCVIAGEAHNIGVRTGNESGTPTVFADSDIYATYQAACGPGDNGCLITDVLNYQKTTGFPGGHKIAGYVSVDNASQDQVKAAIFLFGCITLGINLPGSWANNAQPGFVWDDTNDPSVGGHEVVCMGYNAQGVITSTWGILGTMTWAALADKSIVSECYAAIGPDWTDGSKPAPNGLDLASLQSDLSALGGGTIPPLPDPPTPSPPTPPVPTPPVPVPPNPPIPVPPMPPVPVPVPPLPTPTPQELLALLEALIAWLTTLMGDSGSKLGQSIKGLTPSQLVALILAILQQFFPTPASATKRFDGN